MVVDVPWNRHRWALPFLSRLAPSAKVDAAQRRRHKTLCTHARQMITAVRRWLPGVPLTLLGDTTYSAIALGHDCRRRRVRLIAPLGLKACLHDPLPPATGKRGRGRPRKAGRAQPKLAAVLADPATAWREAEVPWSDGTTRVLELASGTAWWSHSGEPPLPIRWVLTRDPAGEMEPRAYFSTEPSDTAEAIVAEFLKRWPIETTFEESRAHLGIETQRQWSDAAIERETPCLFGLYSVVALLGDGPAPGVVVAGPCDGLVPQDGGDVRRRLGRRAAPVLGVGEFSRLGGRPSGRGNPSFPLRGPDEHSVLRPLKCRESSSGGPSGRPRTPSPRSPPPRS